MGGRRTTFGATKRTRPDRGGRRPATATLLATATVAAILAACGSSPGPSAAPTTTTIVYGQGALRSVPCTGYGPTRVCGGLVSPVPGVTDWIALARNTVPSGTTIHGSVVVENHTGHVINLLDSHGCQPSIGVSAANATIAPGGGFSLVCIGRPLVVPAGISRIAVDVITTYSGCSARSTGSTVRPFFPRCLPHGGLANLPVGRYCAVLIGLGLALPPASAAVTLT